MLSARAHEPNTQLKRQKLIQEWMVSSKRPRLKFITQKAIKPGLKNTTQIQVMLIDKSKRNKQENICPEFYCFLLLKINKRHTLTSCIFLLFFENEPYLPQSKGVNTQLKRKTNCNHKVCCHLFRKHMILIL